MKLAVKVVVALMMVCNVFSVEQKDVLGTWELIDVTGVTLMNSPPRGLAAHKEYYQKNGKLAIIPADEKFNEKSVTVTYKIKNSKRTITTPDGTERSGNLVINKKGHLVIKYGEREVWTYKKLKGDKAYDKEIEPKSVVVIQTKDPKEQLTCLDVKYDEKDYSKLPLEKRVIGVWEVIAAVNSPELPPYGFPNDKTVFTKGNQFYKIDSTVIKLEGQRAVEYSIKGNDLQLNLGSRKHINKLSFNKWGHLEINYKGFIIRLKLLTRDTDKIPLIPSKVSLFINNKKQ